MVHGSLTDLTKWQGRNTAVGSILLFRLLFAGLRTHRDKAPTPESVVWQHQFQSLVMICIPKANYFRTEADSIAIYVDEPACGSG